MYILILYIFLHAFPLKASGDDHHQSQWQEGSIYFIMIDRFNNGDFTNDEKVRMNDPLAYHGGDFEGIIKQLDYLKKMGFTMIWLSPIFAYTEEYHGYSSTDPFEINQHFGSLDTFKALVKEAHQRDLKVIVDLSTNMLEENGVSENQFTKAAQWWIKETDIDGYGIPNIKIASTKFWNTLSSNVKKQKENFILFGDDPNSDDHKNTGIDLFLNNHDYKEVRKAFSKPDQSISIYDQPFHQWSIQFLDNRKTNRFTMDAVMHNQNPGTRWKIALTYLYTIPGVPLVYYGSEIALNGGEPPDNDQQMDFRTDNNIIEFLTKLGIIRNQHPSLRRGSIEIIAEKNGFAVYKRTYGKETTVIAINNTSKTKSVAISSDVLYQNKELRGLLGGDLVREKNNQFKIVIDREETEIYLLANKTGLNMAYLSVMGIVYGVFLLFIIILWKRSRKKRMA